jgi:signal transduction histidine kinase
MLRPQGAFLRRGIMNLHKLRAALVRIDPRSLLCWFAVLLIALLWSMTLLQSAAEKRIEIDSVRRDTASMARLFAEHASRAIEAADQAVMYLGYRYKALGNELDIQHELEMGFNQGNMYNLFSIIDARGEMVLSSQPFTAVNALERDYFKTHLASNSGNLFISVPVLGLVSNKWGIQMTRRISHPDGRFKGVVVVSMDPQYFSRMYRDVDVGKHGSVVLVGNDGVIRASHGSDAAGRDAATAPVLAALEANGRAVLTVHGADGRTRIHADEKLERYPLHVAVGIDLDERLKSYQANRSRALLLATLMSALIVLFCAGIIVLVGRLIGSRARASQARLRFLSSMSHELRSPLNGILGYSGVLRDELGTSQHGGFAGIIHDCGTRLLASIDAVLELSSLESGQVPLSLADADPRRLMTQAASRHLASAASRKLKLESDIDPQVPAMITCDSDKLLRVLEILLGNAIRFTDAGSIRLSVSARQGGLLFAVADTGRGIAPELQSRIADIFLQTDAMPARGELGLAIAARLVGAMGGQMWLQSVPGEGTTLSFSLPEIPVP